LTPRSNALLATLPDSEYSRLEPHLEQVVLHKGQTLFEMGQRPTSVYYPVRAMVSMMIDLPEGVSVEASIFGHTGMVGVAALHEPSFYRATVRNTGLAYRMPINVLKRERTSCPVFMCTTESATSGLLAQVTQNMACAIHHSKEQQVIRWLLVTLDHSLTSVIKITQQKIADLLGFRREVVALVLKKLIVRGEVQLHRGQIEVVNKPALELASCDCYWIGHGKKRPTLNAHAS
jgi:CRP-like cAMP-binding protein